MNNEKDQNIEVTNDDVLNEKLNTFAIGLLQRCEAEGLTIKEVEQLGNLFSDMAKEHATNMKEELSKKEFFKY